MNYKHKMAILRCCLTVASIAACSALAGAQSRCPQDLQSSTDSRAFTIEYHTISMPTGPILLIRNGSDIGAIHIINVHEDTVMEAGQPEWMGTVVLETTYGHSSNGWLEAAKRNVKKETLIWAKEKGGSNYIRRSGDHSASVGPWKFRVSHLTSQLLMGMSTFGFWNGEKDKGFEFAPTSACTFGELDPNDPRLKWFSFSDESKGPLPLDQLPGSAKINHLKEP